MQSLINDLKKIKGKTKEFEDKMQAAKDAGSPPAPDPKSRQHVRDLRTSLEKGVGEAKGITKYVDDLIKNLHQTLTDYNRAEDQNATDLRRNQT